LQSLADIRAGSLPPQSVAVQSKTTNSSSTTKNTARTTDDYEARTEPESGTEVYSQYFFKLFFKAF
uniref:Conjugal transfer protein n=1 Tax=Brugia pahangi TaxID=6280 RepID=A0A0N4TAK6_BRUPA